MMTKTFHDYLAESTKQYQYRFKLAGEVQPEFWDKFEKELIRFDVSQFSEPKKTPIMTKPTGFDHLSNEEVHSVDFVLNYPANEEQIRQIAVSLGRDTNRIAVTSPEHDDTNEKANKTREENTKEGGALLTSEYDSASPEAKAASDEYATGNQTASVNTIKTEYKFAGPPTPKAQTTNDLPQGVKSPMSSINRPARPATGSLKAR